MDSVKVRNLKELVQPFLQKNGKKFISYKCKNLLPPGENYGSVMVALEVKVTNQNNEEETLHYVGKTVPPTQVVRDFFNVPVTVKKEIAHYSIVVPTLNAFGRKKGIDNLMNFFPKSLSARIALNQESQVVDNDAILILENLKIKGYNVGDRLTGCDIEAAKLVLTDLANLHGSVIALKFAEPKNFETKIKPNLCKGIIFVPPDDMVDNLIKHIHKHASLNEKCIPLLSRIEKGMRKTKNLFLYDKIREPLASFVHNDLWTNNIMLKYKNGKPVHDIFVDFQLSVYGSPARDVLFFIYTSVKLEIIETKVDELIKFYYNRLIDMLQKLECDVSKFSYEMFLEEIDEIASDVEFPRIVYMLTPIFTIKGKAKELTEWSSDNMIPDDEEMLHKNYYERLHFTVLDFAKRNWI